jgi:hypothetical protein
MTVKELMDELKTKSPESEVTLRYVGCYNIDYELLLVRTEIHDWGKTDKKYVIVLS